MTRRRQADTAPESGDFFAQCWFLLVSLIVFGAYVAWDRHVFSLIFTLDNSYMASLIMALVVIMSAHCGWHVITMSRHVRSARHWLDSASSTSALYRYIDHPNTTQEGTDLSQAETFHSPFVLNFIDDLATPTLEATEDTEDTDAIVEIHADSVRAPAELGWFFVDLAVRMGLLGTIIGFILIFASLDNISIDGGDDLKNLLIAMSGGMGTALYTTLTGLVGASLLSFQYLILGRQSEHLIGLLLRIRRRLRLQENPAIRESPASIASL